MSGLKKRFYNIDFLRFIFIVAMVFYHVVSFMKPVFLTDTIVKMSKNCAMTGSNIVNAFFIISGFFLFYTYIRKPELNLYEYVVKRFFRLWPTLVFSFFVCLLFGHFNRYDLLNIFFISDGIGLVKSNSHNNASWFICALFFLSIFYFYLLKYFKRHIALFICYIIAFLGLAILGNADKGYYAYIIFKPLLLTTGMVRGLCFIAIGIILGSLILSKEHNFNNALPGKIVFTIVETSLLSFFMYYSVFHLSGFKVDIFYQLMFIGLFLSFIFNLGFLSNLLNSKKLATLGNYSFSIYLMHFPVIIGCQKYIWGNLNDISSLIFTVLACIFAGILVYRFVEKPTYSYLIDKYITKNVATSALQPFGGGVNPRYKYILRICSA